MAAQRPDAATVRSALAEIARQRAELDRVEATLQSLVASADDLVPIKVARAEMGISEEAAQKRAARGAGVMMDGRWFFRRAFVDAVAAKNVRKKCPDASGSQPGRASRQ